MNTRGSAEGTRLVDEIVTRLTAAAPAGPLEDFAHAYLRRVPEEYLTRHTAEWMAAHIRSIYEFVERRRGDEIEVRAFHPTPDDHGYDGRGAVLEVAAPDMAFLVDSVTNEIEAQGHPINAVIHPVMGVVRDESGRLVEVVPARGAPARESIQHYDLGHHLDPNDLEELTFGVRRALRDVGRAVGDFEQMQGVMYRMMKIARAGAARYEPADVEEAIAFLEWLLDDNFVFLGYREYQLTPGEDELMLSVVPDSGLGILRADGDSAYATPVPFSQIPEALRERYESGSLLVVTKTNATARVHRRAKMDYIGVRHIGPDGAVVGEARLIGLFTSKAYMATADSIPLLRRKLKAIIEAEDLIEGSHVYKEVVQLFNSFPTDELFSMPTEDVRDSVVGLIELQENQGIKVFLRRDLLRRSVSLLVVMPRDRFNAPLRKTLQEMFLERFGGTSIDYRLSLGETDTARLHFTVWVSGGDYLDVSITDLEAEVIAAAQTWEERLEESLIDRFGQDIGLALREEWAGHFPDYYRSSTDLGIVVEDIAKLDEMNRHLDGRPTVGLQDDVSDGQTVTRLAVYRADGKLELSAIMPTLEALGLRVIEEVPTRLRGGSREIFIHAFGVLDAAGRPLDLGDVAARVAGTVVAVLGGTAESDSLNRLIVSAGLDHRQVGILRAYRTYWQRVSPGFTVNYINDAFAGHPAIAADLMEYFAVRFDPARAGEDEEAVLARLVVALDEVVSLDEDRILRGFMGLMRATVRTSAYSHDDRLSFKFRSADVPAMPQPAPLFEIFVYAHDVEGIHLRGGMVARGGIRWSTRREDYRTEVLDLMKAQMTKNAVIVPTGSKGGFVLRQPPPEGADLGEAVHAAYTTFIRGLLDITDNRVDGHVRHPYGVRVHDGPDPYLVVAADKGTATFSDTANAISAEYGFWLDDAFASGGSAGYDHKALGITARGAWESVKWHFRELGVDVMRQPFTVVGVGDMSGDVFGNGMLLSPMIRLVAAFDHRHVFIDPDPDPATSFEERRRLFELPRSSWEDYDTALISEGGGVFSRKAKRIDLSPQARQALGVEDVSMTPDDVIHAVLAAPVDLLWNGGIGTYVKATTETHEQVGDRVNDTLRVDAAELRCSVVGEGGNLGLTQRARVEFALEGGRVFTDFIDNAGGVHCSDREVNLKVLLGLAENRGELTREGRDELVDEVVGDVVDAILYDNFLQAQILSQDVERSVENIEAFEDLIAILEAEGMLDRQIERLPSSDEIKERARAGVGMTAPELSVVLAYAKRSLRSWLLASELPDWQDFAATTDAYFPKKVLERFGELAPLHPLRRELIATIVANRVINSEGATFVTRLMTETGASPEQVVRAYHIARGVTHAGERWDAVEALVGTVPADVARELMRGVDDLVESIARWYLGTPSTIRMSEVIAEAGPAFDELAGSIVENAPTQWREERDKQVARWTDLGVPVAVAHRHVYQQELVHAPDIIEVARTTGRPVREVADLFLLAGSAFEIDWLESQIEALPVASRWQRRAVQTVEDDLATLRRDLAEQILVDAPSHDPHTALEHYLVARTHELGRLTRFMRSLAADGVADVAAVIVAIRQIRQLAV